MRTRKNTIAAIATVCLVGIATAAAVDLTWDPPPPADSVQRTFLQVMDLPSSNIVTHSTTNTSIQIPGGVAARRFRAAHSNAFGVGDWTPWFVAPASVTNLKVIWSLVP